MNPVNIGKMNHLQVIHERDFGIYLDAGELGRILLPIREVPEDCRVGDWLDVFIYRDSEDLLIATTRKPAVSVGECAYLQVTDVNEVGAFLDWGLLKDLFVPFAEQQVRMKIGQHYVVYVYLDERQGRILASSRLHRFLSEQNTDFTVNEAVDALVCAETGLGYKAVINNTHLGLFYRNEQIDTLKPGQRLTAYIKGIRADNKIDLKMQLPSEITRDDLSQQIIAYLRQHGGKGDITDKSPPDRIYQQFGVSKSSYKKALGHLYKKRQILIDRDEISLLTP